MVRTPGFDKNGLKKGTWTPEEDWKLTAYVARYGHWNWRQLPKFAGLARSGKSCRLRWVNYLRPNIKKGSFTQEEDETIIKLVQHLGYRWSVIASQLPGRTDNGIKNHWHCNLKKRFQHNSISTHKKVKVSNSRNRSLVEPMPTNNIIDPFQILPSTSQSTDSCSSTTLLPTSEFFTTTNLTAAASNKNSVLEDEFAFLDASKEPMSEFFSLNDFPADPMPNNTIDPFQILSPTSQSTDSCPTSIPSSSSEFCITTDHTTVASNKNLVQEDEFDFLDGLEELMSGIFLLDDSTVDPMPNAMIDPFQILPETSQHSTNSCPTSAPSFSSEFSITTYNNITFDSHENLTPQDEFALFNANEEPINEKFLLNSSPVDQIPMPNNNIIDPFEIIPTISRSTYSCPYSTSSSASEFISITKDHNAVVSNKSLIPEDDFAFMESYKEPMIESFWLKEDTLVEPMANNVICPTQKFPSTSQSTGSFCPTQSSSELFISTYQYHTTEDDFAPPDTLEEHVSGSFCPEAFEGDIAEVAREILLTEPECSVCDVDLWNLDNVRCP